MGKMNFEHKNIDYAVEKVVIQDEIDDTNIPIFRHLEDIDDLAKSGRNGSLVEGQEAFAEKLAKNIFDTFLTPKCQAVFIICSSKKRSFETSEMISVDLKKNNPKLKVKIVSQNSLRDIDQGRVILPEEYKVGEKFEGLQLAGKIFFKEVFGGDIEGGEDNYLYRYSDPVLLEDGNYKYPELTKYFSEPGESYKDVLLRVYEEIVSFSKQVSRFDEKIKFIICTHSLIAKIFQDLLEASQLIDDEKISLKQGTLPRVCWELFKKRPETKLVAGEFKLLPISPLFKIEIIKLLKKEIEFLKNN